jgi:hypothetical protein
MTTTLTNQKQEALDRIANLYCEKGYQIWRTSSDFDLPKSLIEFDIDMVAIPNAVIGGKSVVVIACTYDELATRPEIAEIARRARLEDGWQLDLLVAPTMSKLGTPDETEIDLTAKE